MPIVYVTGDATRPTDPLSRQMIIAHVVNTWGRWGAGFSGQLGRVYPFAKNMYHFWYVNRDVANYSMPRFQMGRNCSVRVTDDIEIVHMLAQSGIRSGPNDRVRCVNYTRLVECLKALAVHARNGGVDIKSVHMPRIGTRLGGGDWAIISNAIESQLCEQGVPVFVYDPPK